MSYHPSHEPIVPPELRPVPPSNEQIFLAQMAEQTKAVERMADALKDIAELLHQRLL
jgi:hypothetical protein